MALREKKTKVGTSMRWREPKTIPDRPTSLRAYHYVVGLARFGVKRRGRGARRRAAGVVVIVVGNAGLRALAIGLAREDGQDRVKVCPGEEWGWVVSGLATSSRVVEWQSNARSGVLVSVPQVETLRRWPVPVKENQADG